MTTIIAVLSRIREKFNFEALTDRQELASQLEKEGYTHVINDLQLDSPKIPLHEFIKTLCL